METLLSKGIVAANGEINKTKINLGRDCTVDGMHPNDLDFFCMANGIETVLRKVLASNSILQRIM